MGSCRNDVDYVIILGNVIAGAEVCLFHFDGTTFTSDLSLHLGGCGGYGDEITLSCCSDGARITL